jgi:hypothetical protein
MRRVAEKPSLWQVKCRRRGWSLALVRAASGEDALRQFEAWQLRAMVYDHGVPPTPRDLLEVVLVPSAS